MVEVYCPYIIAGRRQVVYIQSSYTLSIITCSGVKCKLIWSSVSVVVTLSFHNNTIYRALVVPNLEVHYIYIVSFPAHILWLFLNAN